MTYALRLLIARDVSLNFLTYVASQRCKHIRTYLDQSFAMGNTYIT